MRTSAAISISLMLCIALCHGIHAEESTARKVSTEANPRIERNKILLPMISYLHDSWIQSRRPWFCAVSKESGGIDKNIDRELVQKLQRMKIAPVDKSWWYGPNAADPRPKNFFFLSCDSIEWLTPKRVKVSTSMAADAGEFVTEIYGAFYLDHGRNGWVLDERNSNTVTGD